MIIKKGVAVSNGIAIGKCYPVDRSKVFITGYQITDVDAETDKLKAAVSYTSGALDRIRNSDISGKINTELYEAYKMLLEDELFVGEAETIIKKYKVNAEYALKLVRDNFIKTMSASKNEYLRDRLHDIEHIYQRMQRHMSNLKYDEFDDADGAAVMVSHDLTATDVEIIIKKGIRGFATDIGSKTSHGAILAKEAGIAAVVGLGNVYDTVKKGDLLVIDGFLGQIVVNPDETTLRQYEKKKDDYARFLRSFRRKKNSFCRSADGEEITLLANVKSNDELTLVDVHGLEGVGLYRTEFLYVNGCQTEEDQCAVYTEAADKLKGKRLVVRSFDLGGDKPGRLSPYWQEENPAMGLRAVRYSLKHSDVFRAQLRAVLRAATHGDVKLLIPMVSSVDELLKVRKIIEEERFSLEEGGVSHKGSVSLGVMVELPAAALCVEKFFPYADFFSIGTNDLIQYLLGVDRNNENVSHIYAPAHHSVISVLSRVRSDAAKGGKEVSVCGEVAGDCRYTPMLLGLGFRTFSMNPRSSYMIRKAVSKLKVKDCEKLVDDMMSSGSVKESETVLSRFNDEKINDIYL